MKVLYIINGEHYSGAERVQDLLALQLSNFGYEVDFVCLKADKFPVFRQSKRAALYDVPMSSRFDLSVVKKIISIVNNEGYHLLHTHTPRAALVGNIVSRWTGKPMVHHVHSPTMEDSPNRFRNLINAKIERFSLSKARALITVSASLADYLVKHGFDKRYINIVMNGVPVMEFKDRPAIIKKVAIGTVALFRERKGIEVLIEALSLLKADGLEVSLTAVGEFETSGYREKIMKMTEKLQVKDVITWVGFKKNVNEELEKFDLMVLPSLFGEGLPMVLLEAMAAGVPVISTEVEGVPEAIQNGIDGLIVPPGNAMRLKEAIKRATSSYVFWDSMRRNAFNRQQNLFSDISMARGVAAVYSKIL